MNIDIKLPELGDGITSGDVLEVFVSEGEQIQKDQDICEIESDKTTAPIPCTHSGTISKIHVSEGDTVQVGGVLITVASEEAEPAEAKETAAEPESKDTASPAAADPPSTQPPSTKPPNAEPAAPEQPAADTNQPQPVAKSPAASKPAAAKQPAAAKPPAARPPRAPTTTEDTGDTPVAAGPAVRRFAREVGVDLRQVSGSAPGGRITREDVVAVVRSASRSAPEPSATTASPQTADSEGPAAGEQATDKWGPIRVERLSKIRKTIANQMHLSWETCPRVTNFDDADITELEKFRQSSKKDYANRGIKLTSMPFVIKAVATALRDHPTINASLDMENSQIVYKEYVNVGIAVDTDRGLVVPALRDADDLSIPEIAEALGNIAENARTGGFAIDDLRGGTFTISNLGAIGGAYSTPIINVPEVAILLVGRSRKMPVVMKDDKIAVRLMMPLSLSYDHRLVDGATAARFLNDVISYLEAPSRLLLAP